MWCVTFKIAFFPSAYNALEIRPSCVYQFVPFDFWVVFCGVDVVQFVHLL